MRQDKFRVVASKDRDQTLLCETLGNIGRIKRVEIRNSYAEYCIGDRLLIEYNEYNRDSPYPLGTVIAKEGEFYNREGRIDALKYSMFNNPERREPFNIIKTIKPTEEKEMQNHLVELLAKNFYTIGINFEHSTKSYTYKVPLDTKLEVDDKVIVDTTSGLTIVNVNRVDEDDSGIDLSLDIKYKFIVQKLDTTQYDDLCEKDKAISKVIAQGVAQKARRDLVESYTGELDEGQLNALKDCGVNAEAVKRLE